MREKDSNTSIELSIVMINLRPPTFSDLHPTTAHAKPPPLLLPSPSHSLCIPVTLPSRSPPPRLMQSVTNPECFPPIQTQRERECCCCARTWRRVGGRGAGWFGGVLDVPILAPPPPGTHARQIPDKPNNGSSAQHRSWHGWGGMAGILALKRPLLAISSTEREWRTDKGAGYSWGRRSVHA